MLPVLQIHLTITQALRRKTKQNNITKSITKSMQTAHEPTVLVTDDDQWLTDDPPPKCRGVHRWARVTTVGVAVLVTLLLAAGAAIMITTTMETITPPLRVLYDTGVYVCGGDMYIHSVHTYIRTQRTRN